MINDAYADIVTGLFPRAEIKRIVRLTGGVSADVHRLDLKLINGSATSIVLRAHGATHSGLSAELEFQLIKILHQSGLLVPEPLLVDVQCRSKCAATHMANTATCCASFVYVAIP